MHSVVFSDFNDLQILIQVINLNIHIDISENIFSGLKHGRLKVKTTAEQEEAKRIEREKKVKKYTAVTRQIFQKVSILPNTSNTCLEWL